jgi:hypothetical protein
VKLLPQLSVVEVFEDSFVAFLKAREIIKTVTCYLFLKYLLCPVSVCWFFQKRGTAELGAEPH